MLLFESLLRHHRNIEGLHLQALGFPPGSTDTWPASVILLRFHLPGDSRRLRGLSH